MASNKDKVRPVTVYRREEYMASFCRWRDFRGKILRSHAFYKVSPCSIVRLERVLGKLQAIPNSLDETITSYTFSEAE